MNRQLQFSILLILSTAAWGSTFPLVKFSLEYMSPVVFLAVRFAVSSAVMFPFLKRPLKLSNIREGFIAGTFLFVGYYFQTVGLKYTSPAISGLITGFYVVLVPILSFMIFKKGIGRKDWAAASLSLVGLLIITSGQLSNATLQLGDVLTLICAFGYAMQIIYVARHTQVDMIKFTFYQMLTVCVLSTVFIPTYPIYADFSSPVVIIGIFFTAIVAGVLAYLIMNASLVYVSPERASIIMVTEPVFAAGFSVAFTGTILSYFTIAAGAITVLAMVWEVYSKGEEKSRELAELPV